MLEEITLKGDFEKEFVDYTADPFVYEYNSVEFIEQYEFVHVKNGIFKANPEFIVTKEEMNRLIRTYRDIVFFGCNENKGYEVWFALSKAGCNMDIYEWYEDETFADLDEVIILKQKCGYGRFYSYGYDDNEFAWVPVGETMEPLPEEKTALNFNYNLAVREKGGAKRLILDGYIADMVEPGVYYFHKQKGGNVPELSTLTGVDAPNIAIAGFFGWGISCHISVIYIAIEKKYFKRLKQIADSINGSYLELGSSANTDVDKKCELEVDDSDETEKTELLLGSGFEDLEISFNIPLIEKREFKSYSRIYRKGNQLVLVKDNKREELDMRLMTYLAVKKTVNLRCGYEYEAIMTIIDCEEEKYKEILSPEAYELYQKMWKKQK